MNAPIQRPVNAVRSSTDADLIKNFLQLRDHIKAETQALEDRLVAAKGLKDIIEAELLERLNAENIQSVKSEVGTAYRVKKVSATIKDPLLFKKFVIDRAEWNMVDWRANVPAVEEFIAHKEEVPPGLNISSIFIVNVRKGK